MKVKPIYKESLPLYRHKELYENSQKYQEHKFFSEEDYAQAKRLHKLECRGEDDYEFSHGEYYERCEYEYYTYSDRYSSLKGDTVFFRNLCALRKIRRSSSSYSEYILKASIEGIDEKLVNFELLYTWFAKKRSFWFEFWNPNAPDDPYTRESHKEWRNFREMCKEAFKDGHRNCCKYREFIEHKIE